MPKPEALRRTDIPSSSRASRSVFPAPLLRPILPLSAASVLISAVLLSLGGCGRGREAGIIAASGHIEATEVHLSSKVGGTVAALPRDEGDPIAAGEILAQIDTTDISLQLAAARADRDQAAAQLKLGLAGARAEDVQEAAALAARATADLDGAEKDLARMESLLQSGSGTAKARDDARTRRDQAAASLRAAQEQWKKLRSGSRPEEIEASRARLAGAAARVAQLEQQIRDATVRSPVDGILTERLVEQGELLAPGTEICVITELGQPWLTVYVGEPDLGRIHLGQGAEVRTDSGQTRDGKITFVSSQAEFTPKNVQTLQERVKLVYKVKITLENKDGLFKPGMPAEARIPAAGTRP